MELKNKIDESLLRKESLKNKIPITDLLLKKIKDLSQNKKISCTLLAICPNSINVLKAALRSAKRANSPILFAVTLNQVDIDRGYTGWTHFDIVRIIEEESKRIGLNTPIIIGIDHGGPWVKDIQAIEKWGLKRAMDWTKKSFEAAILAGFDLIHVDTTIDIYNEKINIETVAERTIELIHHSETFRKENKKPPISYEVGTEEVKGGLADLYTFKKFLSLLKKGLKRKKIDYIWPSFVVGKVGTDLHTTEFDFSTATNLVKITSENNTYLKGHYTDFVKNPEQYPEAGIAAANVGPEFTSEEYDGFNELSKLEESLFEKNKIAKKSEYMQKLEQAIIDSKRWKKWLNPDERDFDSIKKERKKIIMKTSSRYVWEQPQVKYAQIQLYKNLEHNGYNPEDWILLNIEKAIDKYFKAFNLININNQL